MPRHTYGWTEQERDPSHWLLCCPAWCSNNVLKKGNAEQMLPSTQGISARQ